MRFRLRSSIPLSRTRHGVGRSSMCTSLPLLDRAANGPRNTGCIEPAIESRYSRRQQRVQSCDLTLEILHRKIERLTLKLRRWRRYIADLVRNSVHSLLNGRSEPVLVVRIACFALPSTNLVENVVDITVDRIRLAGQTVGACETLESILHFRHLLLEQLGS